ncbi:MAG: OmpH family outer membrane protein [Bacteroidales bacterium]|nr:OmpH family outer membrane protein [Bacteroidales bacterium]
MKNIIKLLFVGLILISFTQSFAQGKYKFGHIDSNQLLSIMPEREKAQKELEKIASELEKELEAMQVEFNNKYQDYLAKVDSLSDLIKQTKEAELQEIQQRIQSFQATAQQELQNKETELIKPIIEKAQNAIKEIAKENSFTYIFDTGTGVVLYFSDDSQDIFPLVKKKLGIE